MAALMASIPPSARVDLVETLVWAPAPFQSLKRDAKVRQTSMETFARRTHPGIGFGSKVAMIPNSSAMR
jgi:hypothetical protein